MIQKIIEKYQMWVSVTHGCQVNLRDPKTQRFLRKGWKVMSTHKRLAMLLDLPCRCQKHETHAKCEGKLTSMSALYTKEYAKRVVSAIFQEMTHAMVQQELDGESQTPNDFGVGPYCMSGDLKQHGRELVCGSCVEQPLVKGIPRKDDDPKMNGFKGEQAWVQTGETNTGKTGESSDEEIRNNCIDFMPLQAMGMFDIWWMPFKNEVPPKEWFVWLRIFLAPFVRRNIG